MKKKRKSLFQKLQKSFSIFGDFIFCRSICTCIMNFHYRYFLRLTNNISYLGILIMFGLLHGVNMNVFTFPFHCIHYIHSLNGIINFSYITLPELITLRIITLRALDILSVWREMLSLNEAGVIPYPEIIKLISILR